jgi:hypothetical protein
MQLQTSRQILHAQKTPTREQFMFSDNIFVCPKCSCDLEISRSRWICAGCKREWVVDEDGIVRFLDARASERREIFT